MSLSRWTKTKKFFVLFVFFFLRRGDLSGVGVKIPCIKIFRPKTNKSLLVESRGSYLYLRQNFSAPRINFDLGQFVSSSWTDVEYGNDFALLSSSLNKSEGRVNLKKSLHLRLHLSWKCFGPNSHSTQDATRVQKGMFFLWCFLRAVWTLSLMTTGPICLHCVARRVPLPVWIRPWGWLMLWVFYQYDKKQQERTHV